LTVESFRLIVFDLDGTLIDSRRDLADAANALLESCGAGPLSEEQIGRMVGDGAATLVARVFEASGLDPLPTRSSGISGSTISGCWTTPAPIREWRTSSKYSACARRWPC